jgi:two-component sensor histidine kinase
MPLLDLETKTHRPHSLTEPSLPGQPNEIRNPLFTPEFLLSQFAGSGHRAAIFAAEAAHRAKNLAQLSHAVIRLRLATGLKEIAAAEALAQAYSEIGDASDCGVAVSSKDPLIRVVSSLVLLFGRGDRNVAIHIRAEELLLPPERRRLLVLIASELVINALRHAFPVGRAGLINTFLRVDEGHARLTITDNGIGYDGAQHGQGGELLDSLTAMLTGTLKRSTSPTGGFHASVSFPVGAAA